MTPTERKGREKDGVVGNWGAFPGRASRRVKGEDRNGLSTIIPLGIPAILVTAKSE